MPPITPSNPVQSKSYTVTSTDLLNAIVLEIDSFAGMLGIDMQSDPSLYDGDVEIEVLLDDNTWTSVLGVNSSGQHLVVMGSQYQKGASQGSLLQTGGITVNKFPFSIRFKIFTKATQGSCTIKVNYL